MLDSGVTLREHARVSRSVIDAGSYVGRNAIVEGAILGRNCDVRSNVHVHEGVAIGDQVTLGAQSVIFPDVRIYPYKEVETGAELHESLIWESRSAPRLFARDSVTGLVNVDLTPEAAVRLGAALGTTLRARLVRRRHARVRPCVPDDQALDHVRAELRRRDGRRPPDASGHGRAALAERAELRRRVPRRRVAARPGGGPGQPLRTSWHAALGRDAARGRQALHAAGGAARALRRGRLDHVPGARGRELRRRRCSRRSTPTRSATGASGSWSTTAPRLPRACCRSCSGRSASTASPRIRSRRTRRRGRSRTARPLDEARRLVGSGRRRPQRRLRPRRRAALSVDELGEEVPLEKVLLLFLRLLVDRGWQGRVAVPVNVTSQVDWIVGDRLGVVRTQTSLPALANAAAQEGMIFAGATTGGYIFPQLPSRIRRDGCALQPAPAPCPGRAAALRARRGAAAVDARPPRACTARGRSRAP